MGKKVTLEVSANTFEDNLVIKIHPNPLQFNTFDSVYASSDEIDGHWFVRVSKHAWTGGGVDKKKDEIIGVTSHKERLGMKVYQSAIVYVKKKFPNYEIEDNCMQEN